MVQSALYDYFSRRIIVKEGNEAWYKRLFSDGMEKDSLGRFLLKVLLEGVIIGALITPIFGLFFDQRLADYENRLEIETEKLTRVLEYNAPIIQQRYDGYSEILDAVRNANRILQSWYGVGGSSITQNVENDLDNLYRELYPTGARSAFLGPTPGDIINSLKEIINLKEKYTHVFSDNINTEIESFLETISKDFIASLEAENRTESFSLEATMRMDEAYNHLNSAITQALRLDELPIE